MRHIWFVGATNLPEWVPSVLPYCDTHHLEEGVQSELHATGTTNISLILWNGAKLRHIQHHG